jgi:hypothetical protein
VAFLINKNFKNYALCKNINKIKKQKAIEKFTHMLLPVSNSTVSFVKLLDESY